MDAESEELSTSDNIPKLSDEESKSQAESELVNEETHEGDIEIVENSNSSSKEQKPDEDVPEGFFDDFLKEDFMAGLDIVDEDDEELEQENQKEVESQVARKILRKRANREGRKKFPKERVDHVKKFRESPPGEKLKLTSKHKKLDKKIKPKKVSGRDSELRRLDKELEEIRNAPLKRPEKSGVDADNFDIRRDPEKTRQAIQRDKVKTAKDKEKRLITDIVQTGLVPPGMELEVDMEEVCRIDKTDKEQVSDLREKIRPRKTKSKSIEKSKNLSKKRSPSSPNPIKKTKSQVSRAPTEKSQEPKKSSGRKLSRKRSPLRRSPILRRSPLIVRRSSPFIRRSPLMHRSSPRQRSPRLSEGIQGRTSPHRRNVRSPLRRRSRSPQKSPSFRRRSRSRSRSFTNRRKMPIFRKSRSIERTSNYHRGRDRSYSPLDKGRRRRSHSRSPKRAKKEEKVSFLEELVAKLNETHPPQANMMRIPEHIPQQMNYMMPNITPPIIAPVPNIMQPLQMPGPFFTPAPVPLPSPIQPASQKYDPYDESFFIGTPPTIPASGPNRFEKEKPPSINPASKPQAPQANGIPRYASYRNSDGDTSKLFGDKRIKLSDFLAITAKPQVSNASSAKLQEKIKVIQRCQDAIKVLNKRKFTGPLVVQKTDTYKYSKDLTMSPLLRKPIVQLSFTTPGLKSSNEMQFTRCCETLLRQVGIEKKLDLPTSQGRTNIVPPKEVSQKSTPSLTSTLKQYCESPVPVKIINKSLSTQTDKELSSCKECLRRKGILYTNSGIQAGNPTLTFSVSTQVTEADFYSMIPKTQSLASLTPAQLLGKQSMIADLTKLVSANFDHSRVTRNLGAQDISRSRQIPSPPPPPVFHFPTPQSLPFQHDSPYPPSLFGQSSIPPRMPPRNSNNPFGDDRRVVFNKRF